MCVPILSIYLLTTYGSLQDLPLPYALFSPQNTHATLNDDDNQNNQASILLEFHSTAASDIDDKYRKQKQQQPNKTTNTDTQILAMHKRRLTILVILDQKTTDDGVGDVKKPE